MTKRKTIICIVVAGLIIIQFFRPDRNRTGQVSKESMTALYQVPDTIQQIFQASCMDCHSNNTAYPWYTHLQPVGWLLGRHVRNGKKELNLDEFAGYSQRRQISKLRSMKSQVRDGDMPLTSYTWMHRDARLSGYQKAQLTAWLDKTIDSLHQ